jgi:Mce-associated membrane protein
MGRPVRVAILVLSGLVVLLAGAALWIGAQAREERARADDRRAALDAAAAHAMSLLSLHHRTVEADAGRILATSTGTARKEYEAGLDRLKKTTVAGRQVHNGVLRAAGLVSMSEGTAKVLVVADADIRQEGSKAAPQDRFYRWSMDLTKVGGTWLVSKAVQVG